MKISSFQWFLLILLFFIGDIITSIIGFNIYGTKIEGVNFMKIIYDYLGMYGLISIKIITLLGIYLVIKLGKYLNCKITSYMILNGFIIIGFIVTLNNLLGLIYQVTIFDNLINPSYTSTGIILLCLGVGIYGDLFTKTLKTQI